jgi:hypothetical protein
MIENSMSLNELSGTRRTTPPCVQDCHIRDRRSTSSDIPSSLLSN